MASSADARDARQVTQEEVRAKFYSRAELVLLCGSHILFPLGGLVSSVLPLSKYECALLNTYHVVRACDARYSSLTLPHANNESQDSLDNHKGELNKSRCFTDLLKEVSSLSARPYAKSFESALCFDTLARETSKGGIYEDDKIGAFVHYRAYLLSQINLELYRQNPTYYQHPDRRLWSTAIISPLTIPLAYRVLNRLLPKEQTKASDVPPTFQRPQWYRPDQLYRSLRAMSAPWAFRLCVGTWWSGNMVLAAYHVRLFNNNTTVNVNSGLGQK